VKGFRVKGFRVKGEREAFRVGILDVSTVGEFPNSNPNP
jgi:hypothetical protein